jgi:biopolymer transport protein ExbB/TolQ
MNDGGDFLTYMWTRSRLVQCSLILMVLMFLWTLAHILERSVRYGVAKWQSRSFLKARADLLEQGDWDGIRVMAETHTRSHVATVVLNALREFRKAKGSVSAEQLVEFARRGAQIAANRVHEEWRCGLSSLDAIATTAPFVGLFGTTIGILDSLSRGWAGSKSAYLAFIAIWRKLWYRRQWD